jgi:myo-inositol 2-dehydrogenase/D-chiro-inositol 1-dehydrogenase
MDSCLTERKEFVESIQKDTPTPVTGEDGRAPIVIGMAAKKSYLEKRPVKISEIE